MDGHQPNKDNLDLNNPPNGKNESMKILNTAVKFRKFRFWSDWIDVIGFNYADTGYLLQVKISRFNSKSFKCVPVKAWYNYATPDAAYVVTKLKEFDNNNSGEKKNA